MPTKTETTIEYGSGTLYFCPPEGGDPVAFGPVKGLTETRVEEYQVDPEQAWMPSMATSLTQTLSFEAELEPLSLPKLWLLTRDPAIFAKWATANWPRLARLVVYAKTGRRRDKNLRRLIRLFVEED